MFKRRQNKAISLVASAFTSAFVFNWPKFFGPDSDYVKSGFDPQPLLYPPTFDARCVLYALDKEIIDYVKWRQVDCHINNLYNTTFYALTRDYVKYLTVSESGDAIRVTTEKLETSGTGLTPQAAEKRLIGSVSADKNEILFAEFGINYNNELEQFKKGTLLTLKMKDENGSQKKEKVSKSSYDRKLEFNLWTLDVINGDFWETHSYLFK